MGATRCSACGRDLDEIGQCNMGTPLEPLCEDCWHGTVAQQGHAGAAANPLRVRECPVEIEVGPIEVGPIEVDPAELGAAVARSLNENPWWSALEGAAL